jgi:hypothetical protein
MQPGHQQDESRRVQGSHTGAAVAALASPIIVQARAFELRERKQ